MRSTSTILTGFILLFLSNFATGQQNRFTPLDSMQFFKNSPKVIILTADWCTVCRSTLRLVNKSSEIQEIVQNNVRFFQLEEQHKDPVVFNDSIFYFEPTGMNSGRHQFADYLLSDTHEIAYPTIIFITDKNNIKYIEQSYLTEPEWIVFLTTLKDE